jgi:hypothetical protein
VTARKREEDMILNFPGDRRFEAYWLSNSLWRWKPLIRLDPHFSWLYWGRFAFGWPGIAGSLRERRASCQDS